MRGIARIRLAAVLTLLCIFAVVAVAQPPSDRELVKGIRQVEDGYLEDAATTLEAVAGRLSNQPGAVRELAQAYLYLGIAYTQLETDKAARASFREALKRDPDLKLDAGRWPPKVLRLFAAVQAEAPPAPSPSPAERVPPSPAAPSPAPGPPAAGAAKTSAVDGMEYVWIPPGTFQMGCVPWDSECEADERPRHAVTISRGFWLGKTEVTVGALGKFVAQTGYRTTAEKEGWAMAWSGTKWELRQGASWRDPGVPQSDRNPVVNVIWDDAHAFCAWSGGRLPTEAEWEYAARAGGETIYIWGNEKMPVKDGRKQASVADETGKRKYTGFTYIFAGYDDGYAETAPAGSFAANGFGLHDMMGNVFEWCADWYGESSYAASPSSDPTGAASSESRVVRGGSWVGGPMVARVSFRSRYRPSDRSNYLGLRCARDVSP